MLLLQLSQHVHSIQAYPSFKTNSVPRLLLWTWDPPSSTGDVSVSYILIISSTPLSGSPVTMETTSIQITVSYSTPYDVTIRAVNCVGMSQESSIVDLSKLAISW